MDKIELPVTGRSETGKGPARRLRAAGQVPGIYYSHGATAVPLQVDARVLGKILREQGHSSLMQLTSEVKELDKAYAVIRELNTDPLSDNVLHIDLMGVNLKEEINVTVPIQYEGTPKGEKAGAKPEIRFYELEIRTRADNIPHEITIDISNLDVGDVLHAGDVTMPAGVELVTDGGITLVVLEVRRAAAAAASAEGAEEAAEAAGEEAGEAAADGEGED